MLKIQRTADGSLRGQSDWYVGAVELLIDVIQALSHARDLETVMGIVRTAARNLLGADGATFVLRDEDKCYYADEDAISPLWKGQRFPMSACISGWVMNHACPAVIPDLYADERTPVEAYRPTFVKSMAMVPIRQDNPLGAIGTYWASLRQPTDEEVRILQALANATAVTLENIDLFNRLQRSLQLRERAVIDNIREAVITFNEDGTITSYNSAAETIFGYERQEAIGTNLAVLMPAIYRQAISGNHNDRVKPLQRKDGEAFPAEISIAEFVLDEQCCFSAVVRDITERLAAEQKLRDSEERYELAVKGSNDGLWDLQIPTGKFYWSDRLKEMLGITDPRYVPTYDGFKSRLHPEDRQRVLPQLEHHPLEHQPFEDEFRMQREDGTYIWVRARGAASYDQNGRPLRISGSLTDITLHKQAELDLAQALAQAEKSNADKSYFINHVSNDMRMPLATILTAIRTISENVEVPTQYQGHISQAYRTANGLLTAIDSIGHLPTTNRRQG